jgi:hypothetical protein
MENEKKEMTIKEKIDALQLVPLFPDTNYFIGKDKIANEYAITNDSIIIRYNREEANLTMTALMIRTANTKKYSRVFLVVNTNGNTRIYENFSSDAEQEYLDNLTELLNKFNEYYEATAKVFNEELMKSIKEELEKEKEKQKQKEEQEKQEQEEKGEEEKSEEQEESEEGESEEGEGEESEEGEGEESEEGEGEEGEGEGEGEMSSEEIQKMIDELSKDQSGQGQEGQSDNKGDEIDLEDFLNEVEKGNADNDFGKDYNNKDLKGKIDYEKQQQEQPDGQEQPKGRQEEPKYTLTNVLGTIKEMFNTNDEDMKRRFPNPTSISDFVDSLSKAKIEELSNKVGLPSELSNLEKTKQIKTNLITEIQNI